MSDLTFLHLPGEIRNQIYNLLLVLPPPSKPKILGSDQSIYPLVLLACRKVYHEARAILYGTNTFLAHYSLLSSMPQLLRWHKPITSAALISMIKRYHVCVRLDCDPRFNKESVRDAFTSVESLTVEVFQSQFGSSGHEVLELFEDVRGVDAARVYGSVTAFPNYVSWLEKAMMSPVGTDVPGYRVALQADVRADVSPFDLWTVSTNLTSCSRIKLIFDLARRSIEIGVLCEMRHSSSVGCYHCKTTLSNTQVFFNQFGGIVTATNSVTC